MITLYAAPSPNVVKVYLALEEMGLGYEARPVDMMTGQNFTAEFLRLNPNAKVPVIVDEDEAGGRQVIFESGAILIYLAEKTGRFLSTDPTERYRVLEWLMVQMSGLGPLFGQLIHFQRYAPKGNDYALARYEILARRVIAALEARLSEAEWLGGSTYSIADVATFPWVRSLDRIFGPGIEADHAKLTQWAAAISARPATARALAAVERIAQLMTPPAKASPATVDRFFGRTA